ncbi:hypothetical protein A0257_03910 [Hymenobacter psoromatis]|nr:hypothetical protein A0257_03910 [Hymenobacter psoromatis]
MSTIFFPTPLLADQAHWACGLTFTGSKLNRSGTATSAERACLGAGQAATCFLVLKNYFFRGPRRGSFAA